MISILTIIIIFCLINYYIKKDLFTTTTLGLSLSFIYLVMISDFSLNILFYKKNIQIYILFIVYMVAIISFKIINDRLNYSYIKDKLQDMFDSIFHEKKIKFIFLVVIAIITSSTPIIGIILLMFLGTFLRISKYNLITMPFVLMATLYSYNELINSFWDKGFGLPLLFLVILYVELFMFLTIERQRKIRYRSLELIIDYVFYIILFIFNLAFLFIAYNVVEINLVMVTSVVLTLITGMYLITRFDIFLNKEIKEYENQNIEKLEKLQNYKLPYLIMFAFIISYVIGYTIYIRNNILGLIFFIIINIIYINSNKKEEKPDYNQYMKFLIVASLSLVNFILLEEILYVNSSSYVNLLDNYVLNHSNFVSAILIVQNYIFLPAIGLFKDLTSTLTTDSQIAFKLLLSMKIQMIISFINIYIVSFIFKLKKQELLVTISMLLVFSFVLQLIIYSL